MTLAYWASLTETLLCYKDLTPNACAKASASAHGALGIQSSVMILLSIFPLPQMHTGISAIGTPFT